MTFCSPDEAQRNPGLPRIPQPVRKVIVTYADERRAECEVVALVDGQHQCPMPRPESPIYPSLKMK